MRQQQSSMRRRLPRLALLAAAGLAAGCTVSDTKPLPKINPVQATTQIPKEELLNVAIRAFDPHIPAELANNEEALAKRRIFPDVRKAEAKLLPTTLRNTLEASGEWGAVRVVPDTVQFVDVLVNGRILESTGVKLALEIDVSDSSGRKWIDKKRYESAADLGSYKTEAALKARDPFQNVYSDIANDMLAAREKLSAADRRAVQRLTELRFGADLAPQALGEYVQSDVKSGMRRIGRLPAENDPVFARVKRIRDSDGAVVDTVDGYYTSFSDQIRDSYGNWRRDSAAEIDKEDRALSSARTRTVLGAAAVLASIFAPGNCAAGSYNCQYIRNAARTAGAIGGTAAVLSGVKKYSDARSHAQALKELTTSFQAELEPQVVEVEGRTLKLTGTAEEQYREWRQLLQQLYLEDSGNVAQQMAVTPAGAAAPGVPAAVPAGPAPSPAPEPVKDARPTS